MKNVLSLLVLLALAPLAAHAQYGVGGTESLQTHIAHGNAEQQARQNRGGPRYESVNPIILFGPNRQPLFKSKEARARSKREREQNRAAHDRKRAQRDEQQAEKQAVKQDVDALNDFSKRFEAYEKTKAQKAGATR